MGREPKVERRVTRRLLAAALALSVLGVAGCSNETGGDTAGGADEAARELSGVVRDPVPDVSSLSLPLAIDGTPFPFVAAPGGLVLVYFGYTACPDICPTTLADIKGALKQLGDRADAVTVAMATIDPRRDSAEVIDGYLRGFFPDSAPLRTEDEAALRSVADAFGVSYEVAYPTTGEPKVTHSAYTYAVDDQGRVVLQWPFGSTSADIALDLGQLLDQQGAST